MNVSLRRISFKLHMRFSSQNSRRWIFGLQFTKILVKGCHVFRMISWIFHSNAFISFLQHSSLSWRSLGDSSYRDFIVVHFAVYFTSCSRVVIVHLSIFSWWNSWYLHSVNQTKIVLSYLFSFFFLTRYRLSLACAAYEIMLLAR